MTDRVGIGLLSFAHTHQDHWARSIDKDGRAFIAGVWDEDPVRGRRKAGEVGAPWFEQVEDLLGAADTDAVALCCANDDKPDLVRRIAAAGRHLLIEKPPAASTDDLPQMIRHVEEAGIVCVQSFPQRLIPGNRTIKAILDAGELGPIGMVRKRHGHGFALAGLARDMPWIVDPERAGGGALLDEGVHEMDLLRHYFGDPDSVVAEVGDVHTDLPVEDTGVMLFRFPGGVIVELASGWAWRAGGPSTEIYGSDGTLLQFFTDSASHEAPDPAGAHVRVWRTGADAWEERGEPFPFKTLHERMARHFVDVLVDGAEANASLLDGYRAMLMAQGAYEAAASGRRYVFDWGRVGP